MEQNSADNKITLRLLPSHLETISQLSALVDRKLLQEKDEFDAKLKKKRKRISINTSKARGELKLLKHFTTLYGWREVFTDGDVLWSGLSIPAEELGLCTQLPSNRMPGMAELAHKKTSGYYLNKFREYFPDEFDFFPRTFLIPEQYEEFEEFFKSHKHDKQQLYIAKPSSGAQGDGIRLVSQLRDLALSQYTPHANELVVQQYIARPMLLNGKKFDLRLYVLISSDEPYLCYLNDEGMARFCSENYAFPNEKNLKNVYMHLTNYSLNKDHANFKTLDSETDIFGINDSSKRLFSSVLQQISADEHLRHIDIKALLANIEEVIVKFLAAMHPFILFNNMAAFGGTQNHKCFHVLGFDILLDEAGKPWILEVNANPSFNIEHEVYHSDGTTETELSPVDKYIKGKVVGDAVQLVLKSKERQLDIGVGENYRSWKCLVSGDASEGMDVFKKIIDVYAKVSGFRFKSSLTATRFVRLASYTGMTNNNRLTKTDYDLIFKKILRGKFSQQHMDIYDFIQALEEIASRLDESYSSSNKLPAVQRIVENLLSQMDTK